MQNSTFPLHENKLAIQRQQVKFKLSCIIDQFQIVTSLVKFRNSESNFTEKSSHLINRTAYLAISPKTHPEVTCWKPQQGVVISVHCSCVWILVNSSISNTIVIMDVNVDLHDLQIKVHVHLGEHISVFIWCFRMLMSIWSVDYDMWLPKHVPILVSHLMSIFAMQCI